MGVTISTHSTIAPISLASTIIGFISFVFTVGTATRVFWTEISTWSAAPREIDDTLTNLKQSLLEERFHIKRARRMLAARRRSRSAHGKEEKNHHSRDQEYIEQERQAALKAMSIAIKHMIRDFRKLERPFLRYPDDDPDWRKSTHGNETGYSDDEWHDDVTNFYFHPDYKQCGIAERLSWLKTKTNVQSMSESLAKLTIRRIGIQMTYITTLVHHSNQYSCFTNLCQLDLFVSLVGILMTLITGCTILISGCRA